MVLPWQCEASCLLERCVFLGSWVSRSRSSGGGGRHLCNIFTSFSCTPWNISEYLNIPESLDISEPLNSILSKHLIHHDRHQDAHHQHRQAKYQTTQSNCSMLIRQSWSHPSIGNISEPLDMSEPLNSTLSKHLIYHDRDQDARHQHRQAIYQTTQSNCSMLITQSWSQDQYILCLKHEVLYLKMINR